MIPAIGTLVVVGEHEKRDPYTPVMHRHIGVVERVFTDVSPTLLMLKPVRHFCYVLGYHELGRYLPAHLVRCALDECYPLFTLETNYALQAC